MKKGITLLGGCVLILCSLTAYAQDASVFLERGIQSFEVQDYRAANEFLQKTLKEDPNNARAHYWQGRVYEAQNQEKAATQSFERAYRLDGKDGKINASLGLMYAKQGKESQAKDLLQRALKNDQETADVYAYLGKIFEKEGDLKRALYHYEQASNRNNQMEMARMGVIRTQVFSGKKPSSMMFELQSMKADFPKNIDARRLLGDAYVEKRDPNTAIKEYSAILKINAKDGLTWLKLGQTLSRSQRYEQANKALDRAILYGASKEEVYFEKGLVAYQTKQDKSALNLFNKCTQENPDRAACWMYQGKIHQRQRDYPQAEKALERGLRTKDGKTATMYATLGDVYFAQKKYDPARQSYQSAVSQDKNSAHGHYGLGRVYEATGNFKGALSSYEKATDRGGQEYAQKSRERKGFILLSQDRYRDAFRIFQEVVSLNPNDAELWNAFGESALGIKDYTTALDAFDRSIAFRIDTYHAPYVNKARTYEAMQQYDQASKAYQVAVQREPKRAELWESLVLMGQKTDDFKIQAYALKALQELETQKVKHPYRLGVLYQSRNSLIQAKQAYLEAYKRDAKHIPTLVALGDLAFQAKNLTESKGYFAQVIEIKPAHTHALDRLGTIAMAEKQYKQAATYFERYLEVEPGSPKQAYYLAIAHDRMNVSDAQLIQDYERAYELNPKNEKAGIRIAQLKQKTGDTQGAIDTYDKVLKQTPEAHDAREQKAMILLSQRKFEDSAKEFELLHRQRAPTSMSAKGLARSYRFQNKPAEAEKNYALALSMLEEKDLELEYELALVQIEQGKDQEARDTLTQITIEDPNQVQAQETLGDLYMKDNQPIKATTAYLKVTQIKPRDAQAFEKLGLSYKASNKNEQAKQALTTAIKLDDKRHASYFAMATLEQEKALWYYERATQIKPNELEYQFAYAQELYDQKKYRESLAVFQKCERLGPQNTEVLMGLAKSFEANEKHKEAAQVYDKVARMDAKNVNAWSGLGRAQGVLKNYGESAKAYEEAFKLAPNDVGIAYLRGRAYQLDNQYPKALSAFEHVHKIDPKHFGALYQMGVIHYELKDFDQAQARLEQAIVLKPRDAKSHRMLGEIYFQKDRLDQSFESFRVVQQETPKDPLPHLRIGMIQRQWKKYGPAEENLKTSIKLDATNPIAHFELGLVYRDTNKNNLALTSFERATQIKDDFAQAWYEKALLFDLKKQKKRKVRSFEKAIEAKRDYTEARVAFARMYQETQEYLLAIEQYREVLKYAPDERDIVLTLGKLDLAVDKPDFAVRDVSNYAKKHPKDTEVQFLLGKAYFENEDYKDAKRVFSEVVLLERNHAEAHTYLGLIYKEEGKNSRAKKSFERAIDIDNEYALAYYGLGQVLVDEEQYQQAINMQNRALSLDPNLTDAYFYIGMSYKALGKEDEADAAFSKSVPVDGIDGLSNPKDLDKAYRNFRK